MAQMPTRLCLLLAALLRVLWSRHVGLPRCRWQACREKQIDPYKPTRLPLPPALDARLGMTCGFSDVADRDARRRKQGDI
jgi:hypothetical protein